MKWIGLTGGIATGKSTVAKLLRDQGLPVVDADYLAREVIRPGSEALKEIESAFGPVVINKKGELDRQKTGAIVFSNEDLRNKLESIIHPKIQELRAAEKLNLEQLGVDLAFYDVPLLFEKNMQEEFDATILIYADEAEQRRRLKERDGLSDVEIDLRLKSQMPIEEKRKLAKYLIFNTGDLSLLRSNLEAILKELSGS